RTDFRINGNSDFVGFAIASNGEGGDLGSHEVGAYIWAKPFGSDILKLTVGKFIEDNLRGKIGNLDGGFSNFVLATPEEDAIFQRFASGSDNSTYLGASNGFMLSTAPIDGLFLGAMVNANLFKDWEGAGSGDFVQDAYRFMQIGAGYNIEGIGHIRAQWIGGFFGTLDSKALEDLKKNGYVDPYGYPDWCYGEDGELQGWVNSTHLVHKNARIEAAFALTAVDNLLIDLGAKFWLPIEYKDLYKVSNGVDVSLGANFRMEAFAIGARIDSNFGSYLRAVKDDDSAKGMSLQVHLVPTFDLDVATIGLSLGMKVNGAGKNAKGDSLEDNSMQFGFGAFVGKGLGSGSVKAGLSFTTAPIGKDGANGSTVFQIPIILEYAFF
ncbi:MAG: hypothetical protein FWC24_03235, partial [Treponema sp.]|nr:hypothetical protein [Treponema sp.]